MNYPILFSLCVMLLGISCKSDTSKSTQAQTSKSTSTEVQLLPTMDQHLRQELLEKCDAVDYVFDNLPYSMSLDDKVSIRQNLQLIDSKPCTQDYRNAPHLGRQHFMMDGDIRWIADIYFGPECNCYVFSQNNTPTFAHAISPAGINFYTKMINGVKATPKQ